MILDMINVLPEKRLSADQFLKMWCPLVFPEYFSPLLHDFFSYLVPLDTDNRVSHKNLWFLTGFTSFRFDMRSNFVIC